MIFWVAGSWPEKGIPAVVAGKVLVEKGGDLCFSFLGIVMCVSND
jgi:hypothetical protein